MEEVIMDKVEDEVINVDTPEVRISGGTVALIAVGVVGAGFALYKLGKHLYKKHQEKKANVATEIDAEAVVSDDSEEED